MSSGLERYRRSIHDLLYADIASWRGHPELSTLLETLESITDPDQFSNALAETRLAPRSYFWICWKVIPSAAARSC